MSTGNPKKDSFALSFAKLESFAHVYPTPEQALTAQLKLTDKLASVARTGAVMSSAMAYGAVRNGILGKAAQKGPDGKPVAGTGVKGSMTQGEYADTVGLSKGSIGIYIPCGQALVMFGVRPESSEEILPARSEVENDQPVTHARLWNLLFGQTIGADAEVTAWLRANANATDIRSLAVLVRSVQDARDAKAAAEAAEAKAAAEALQAVRDAGGTPAAPPADDAKPVEADKPAAILKRLEREARVIAATIASGAYADEKARTALLGMLDGMASRVRNVGKPAKAAPKPGPRRAAKPAA
jgi:hypothetical protein